MDLGLKDKVIIVTGGSKGIGNGICNTLAAEGAIPVIVARKEQSAKDAVKTIQENGGDSSYIIAELADPVQCKNVVDTTLKRYGKIDGVVNNAGVNDGVSLHNGSYETFIESLKKNLVHYYLIVHHALPELKKNKGAIVNIGSKTSITGQGGTSAYAAANGGRNSLTREWAVELLPYSIRVNAVIVAECYTPMYDNWIQTFDDPKEKLKQITDKIPLEKKNDYSN